MRPESGRSRPSVILSRTLLPTPAGPIRMRVSPGLTVKEMLLSTGFFSKPIVTFSKTTAGPSGGRWLSSGARATWLMRASPAQDADHEAADDEVGCDDEDRRDDDGLCCRPAHALCAAASRHSVVAANGGDDKAEDERLEQPLKYVGIMKRLIGGMEVLRAILPKQEDSDRCSAEDADSVRDDGEKEEHDDRGGDARHHQLLERIGAERAHGVDLLGHHH